MTYRVIVQPSAEVGIRQAFRRLNEHQSFEAAARWYNGLERKIGTLRTQPRRCPVAAESEKFPEEIRELLHGRRRQTYRVLFAIREDEVHILYVRHSAQDEVEP